MERYTDAASYLKFALLNHPRLRDRGQHSFHQLPDVLGARVAVDQQYEFIATEAGVKKLVLSHLVPVPFSGMSDQVWIDAVRPTWQGELVVGHDLMEIAL